MMQSGGRRTAVWTGLGFLCGVYHVMLLVLAAAGAGHGHGSPVVAAIWFGYGAPLWFILPPLQYALYARIACLRKRRLGVALAVLHYAGTVALIALPSQQAATGLSVNQPWPDLLLLYGPFVALNIAYFRRILIQ